ncbi:MAG: hypothetical protein RIR29_208 [Actinomycetota bacterium]
MSNKLTRKSLAFGALVALGSSVIAGAPAQAANELVVAPSAGTSYNTFVDSTFNLVTTLAPGFVPASYAQLKYQIVTDGTAAVQATSGVASQTKTLVDAATPFSGNSSNTYVVASVGATSTTVNYLGVNIDAATSTTATSAVAVTAFIDANNDGALTAGEWNTSKTINFKKYADVVPTVALTPVLAGDTSVKATATYADLNVEQLTAADFTVLFTVAGASGVETGAGVVAASGVYTDSGLTGVAGSAAVTAIAKYKTVSLGTAVTGTVTAQTVATVTAALVEDANAKVITSTPTVRLNNAFKVKTTLRAAIVAPATVGVVVPNKAVTLVVTGAGTLTANRTLTINNTTYNNVTALPASLALTSDANGEVLVSVKSTGFLVADADLVFTFTSENISTAASVVTVDQVATVYSITADNGNLYSTPLGTSKAVAFSVKDQFGTLTAETTDRIAVTPSIVSGLTAYGTLTTAYLPVVGGKATYTATSGAATAAGQLSLATALQTLNSATQNYDAYSPAVAGTAVLVNVTTAADSFTTAPAATATAKVTADAFTDAIASAAAYRADYSVVVANPGTALTVAAPGAYIKAGTTFGEGTVTVNTPANGTVAVVIYAHTVGTLTATFTNGVAVKTSVITLTTDLAPAKVTLVTPAQAQVGQALDVVINVTDKWDNVVATPAFVSGANAGALVLSSTGTGYFASTAPVANAAGKATVKYIVGTADIGTAYLSATLDLATDVTAAKSIEFGLTDGDVVAGGKRVFVNAEFAKGRTVTVSIDGKRVYSKVQTTDNAVELAFTQKKAGVHTVTVRISGGIVFTEKVTTN